jgi:16S rRNA (guanine527-N7)-methyltransferase
MDILRETLEALGASDIENKLGLLTAYKKEILDWNKMVNLTSISEEEFDIKHYVDSLSISDEDCVRKAHTIIDIGTGAGFPGVPLAVLYPEKKFVLVDSLNKRVKIITETVDKLGITNVEAVHGRAEELANRKEYREAFDLCVSRAVANLSTLSEYCIPFVKTGGFFLAYKGPESVDEIAAAANAVRILGGAVPVVRQQSFRNNIEGYDLDHITVIIKKEKSTPKKYPRKAGTPSKEPLK